ncbi:hypothetical protein LshimejAT787_2500200 [Lyophyllum shimeji]|uniref:Uncharacterized protein n=1 Tax=Lyophyllum shimeji TaxID=47721 RepID=A0A9P3Q0Y5_LYOSH|nr:hypothetical protein LshimejAT787_2500060 [Lyophyllum shimeji]GLB45628.1 hypothetical protein LshimejAT787_2500200 [Lyophyllum shimeji]
MQNVGQLCRYLPLPLIQLKPTKVVPSVASHSINRRPEFYSKFKHIEGRVPPGCNVARHDTIGQFQLFEASTKLRSCKSRTGRIFSSSVSRSAGVSCAISSTQSSRSSSSPSSSSPAACCSRIHKFAVRLVQFILGHLFRKQRVRLTTSKLRSEHLRMPLPDWRLSGTRKNSDRHRHVSSTDLHISLPPSAPQANEKNGHIPEASPKAAAVSEQIQDARPVIPSKVKGRKLSETQRTISALCLTLCVGDVNKRDLTTSSRASVAFFAWSAVSRTSAPQQFRTCFPTCCALELVVPTTLLVADRGCGFKEGINRLVFIIQTARLVPSSASELSDADSVLVSLLRPVVRRHRHTLGY